MLNVVFANIMPSTDLLETMHKRFDVMRCLRDGITTKSRIEKELGVSRQTVGRALTELEDHGLITDARNDCQEITSVGEIAYETYTEHQEVFNTLSKGRRVLNNLPIEIRLDKELLREVTIINEGEYVSQKSFAELERLIQPADNVIAVTPVFVHHQINLLSQKVTETPFDLTIVTTNDSLREALEMNSSEMTMLLESENCTVITTSETLSCPMYICDEETVWLGSFDENGSLCGALVADSDHAVDCTTDLVTEYIDEGSESMDRESQQIQD